MPALDKPGLLIEVLTPLNVGCTLGSQLLILFVYFERQASSFVVLADPKLPSLGIIVHTICPRPRAY